MMPVDVTKLCNVAITCPGTDSPVTNTSSENSDGPNFDSAAYPSTDPSQEPNPIAMNFVANGCLSICNSGISEDDAQLCAQRQTFICQHTNPQTGVIYRTLFLNKPVSATVNCPDGIPFTYTVGAGLFIALSQYQANQEAVTRAGRMARQHLLCLSNIPTAICVGLVVFQNITASTSFSTSGATWSVSSGALPAGLSFGGIGSTGTIFGTPSVTGTYTFSITITLSNGDNQTKQYTVTVSGITNSTPLPTMNGAYSQQLNTFGFITPVFTLASGTFPMGITLSSTGLISGTATQSGTFNFTIMVTETGS